MKTHKLNTLEPFYSQIEAGHKTFEIRKDDRDFQVGDLLILWQVIDGQMTDKYQLRHVLHILRGCPECGLADGYCILSLNPSR